MLNRLADSLDFPILKKLVVNNGEKGALDEWLETHSTWCEYKASRSQGLAGIWNLAPSLFDNDAWLIASDDTWFHPGQLEKFCRVSDECVNDKSIVYTDDYQSFEMFIWHRRGVEKFGLFDENYWPAYFEDTDMKARFATTSPDHHCVGLRNGHQKPSAHDEGYWSMSSKCYDINKAYFESKWGSFDHFTKSGNKHPVFSSPFNNPQNPVCFWERKPEQYQQKRAIFDSWWNSPNRRLFP